MKNIIFKLLLLMAIALSNQVLATGFVGGVPTSIMKTDYSSLHLVFISLETPVDKGSCSSGAGLVIHDSNESSKVALSLAMTAFASGKTFQCYVGDECSKTTGSLTTYPVCNFYPRIVK